MTVEICYEALKTVKVEVDDNYKEMVNNDDAWNKLIGSFSEIVVKKIREIEDDASFDNDNILGVFEAETGDVIYEN